MPIVTGRTLLAGSASAAALVAGIGGFSSAANAQAFYLQEQSVRGQGRAFSGEAADTGVESIWWNPASIGGAVSSGCIRLTNTDIIDLYNRAKVGAKVIVRR